MRRLPLLLAALFLSTQMCFAQQSEPQDGWNVLDDPALREFNHIAQLRPEKALLKVLRFEAPSNRVYYVTRLDPRGHISKARHVTDPQSRGPTTRQRINSAPLFSIMY